MAGNIYGDWVLEPEVNDDFQSSEAVEMDVDQPPERLFPRGTLMALGAGGVAGWLVVRKFGDKYI